MMSREHHRRRSPESSRRRRKERRDSREQLQNHPIPPSIPPYEESFPQPRQQPYRPSYQQPFQESYQAPHESPSQPEPSLARDRDRGLSSSLSSTTSSSSTSSSLLNISQPATGFGFGSFFSGNARKQRRRIKKKRSKILRFGNSSSSSVGSDLAYGRGYINRRSSREFSPPTGPRPPERDSDPERPRPPRRAQTDEEIIELGRKFAELARQQNTDDLRAAGRTRPSTLASAATALNQFRRTNSGNSNKGIGNSKPRRDSSPDESDWEDWESASSDDESGENDSDNGLAYGSSHHLPSNSSRPSHFGASFGPTQTYSQDIPLNRKPSLVDPKLFGPVNSLRGFVRTPCGFERVDRNAVDDVRPHYEPSIAPGETVVSAEGHPMQHVYPVPTSDPSRFDVGHGSIVSAHQDLASSPRPDPVPIQQPKPITPVYRKVFDSVDTDPKYSNRPSTARAVAQTGGIGLPDAAINAPLSSDAAIGGFLRAARKADQNKYEESRSDDPQWQSERSGVKGYAGKYEKYDGRDVLRDVPPEKPLEKDPEATRNDEKEKRRGGEMESDLDRDFKRESRRRDKYHDNLDRTAEGKGENNDLRDDQKVSRRERRREKSRENQTSVHDPKNDVPAPSEEPSVERLKSTIDPFQYQVADDAFATPRYGTPIQPLTPVIMTVDREPDFSKFESYVPYERLSRKDSFERELQDAQNAYKAAEQATVPVSKAAFAAAAAVEIAERRHKRSPERDAGSRDHSQDSSSATRPKDPVLDDADRAYREARLARRIREQEERSRSNSPDSVVDKWKDEGRDSANASQVVTPPALDHPKQKNPFDGPNADVRIDNVLEHPKELSRFRVSESRRRSSTFPIFSARDPSAERERPMLNLVRPTPAPSPIPEKQQLRNIDIPSPTTKVDTDSMSAVIQDEVVSTSSAVPSKVVTWGENQTKHYVVESPERENDPYSGTRIITPAETSRSRTDKKGWGAIMASISGVGVGIAASSISGSGVGTDVPREHVESKEPGQSSKKRHSLQFDALYDDPPIPGPKPPSPRSHQMPGRFAEDPVFMASIAAGLEGSGFDPNIIIDDAKFHRRDSPPGSNEPFGTSAAATSQSTKDNAHNRGDTSFAIGELRDSATEEKEISSNDSEIFSRLSKKERRKQEKAAEQDISDKSVLAVHDDPVPETPRSISEEDWAIPASSLTKKEQKRRDGAADRQAWEDDQVSRDSSSIQQAPEPVIDNWVDTSLKKKKPKKSKRPIVIQQDSPQDFERDPQQSRNVEPCEATDPVDTSLALEGAKTTEQEVDWATMSKDTKASEWEPRVRDFGASLESIPQYPEQVIDDSAAPQEEWPAPSKDKKKRKKKAKRDSVADEADESVPSTAVAPELSRESSYAIVEPGGNPIPPDEWDLPKKGKTNKSNLAAADSLPRSLDVSEVREEMIKWDAGDEASGPVTGDDVVDDWDPPTKQKKESKRDASPSRRTPLAENIDESPKKIVDSFSDPHSESVAAAEDEWVDLPKKVKKKKKPKRDATTREESPPAAQSAPRSGVSVESPRKTFKEGSLSDSPLRPSSPEASLKDEEETKVEDRSSAPGGFPKDEDSLNERQPPGEERGLSGFEAKKGNRNSSFFDRLKSSIGLSEGNDQSRTQHDDESSFLDNAGALGASAGLTGAAIALALQKLTGKAADTAAETGSLGETMATERCPSSPSQNELIDPEIVEREIRPAIDPTYGDLLPLPPSRPSTPVPVLDETIPPLPESRPGTPEDERERLLLAQKSSHTRRRSDIPLRVKTPSNSAIPLQFRLGQRVTPASPGILKQSPSASPITATPETGSASKARARPMSWESTRTFKPLLLVERTCRESAVTPTPLQEEPQPSDIPDRAHDVSSPTPSHTVTPRGDLQDGRSTQEATAQLPELPELPLLKPVEEPESPTPKPDPVDPVSKNRSSYLLYSSPPGPQNSNDAYTSEGSPSLRAAKRYTALDEVKEFDDITDGDLLITATPSLAAGALVASALVDDRTDSPEVLPDTKDSTALGVTPLGESKELGETIATNETGTKDSEPSQVTFISGKKSKKGKKGKNKSREIEPLAEASSVEVPVGSEVPSSSDTLESVVNTDEKGDGLASTKLSKKDKKKRKKEQSRGLPIEDEKTVEESLPAEGQGDEFFDAPAEQTMVEPQAEKAETNTFVDTHMGTPTEAPTEVVETPAEASVEAVVEAPVETTIDTLIDASANVASEAPVKAPVEALVEAVDTPADATREAPVAATIETPTEAVVEAPVEAIVEAPVEAVDISADSTSEAPVAATIEAPTEAIIKAPVEAVDIPADATREALVVATIEAPTKAVVEAPVEAVDIPADSTSEAPVEAPVEAVVEAPVEAVDIPADATREALVAATIETPTEAVLEAPVEAPVEAVDIPADATREAFVGVTFEAPAPAAVEAPVEAPVEAVDAPADAASETFVGATFEAPAEAAVEAAVEPTSDALALDEPMVTTRKGKKKKKKRNSQVSEPETGEQPSLTMPEGDSLEETVLPASDERAIVEGPIPTPDETDLEREMSSTTLESPAIVSKKGKKKKGKKSALSEEESITARTPDVTTPAEHIPLNAGQDIAHPIVAETTEHGSKHVQGMPVEAEDAASEPKEALFDDTPQGSPAAEEWPAATSKKSKTKKISQALEPGRETPAVADTKTDPEIVEEAKPSEAELPSSKAPDELGPATEAIPPAQIPTVGVDSLLNAPAEVVEPNPVLSGEPDEKFEPASETPQPLSDTMTSAIVGLEPASEEKKLKTHESEGEAPVQASELGSIPFEGHPVDASQLPALSDVDESQLKSDPLSGEESQQGPEPIDAAKDPLTENAVEGLHSDSTRSLDVATSSNNLLDAVSDSKPSLSDPLTGDEHTKAMDGPEEPQGKKKAKKNKKKKQSASDLSDVQETVATSSKIEDVQGQPAKDTSSIDQATESPPTVLDTTIDLEQADAPTDDALPDTGSSNNETKNGKEGEENSRGLDVGATDEVEELHKPAEEVVALDDQGIIGSEKSAALSQAELAANNFLPEPTTPTKKSKKKNKKNRQSADLSAPTEDIYLPPVEADPIVAESVAGTTQPESEPNPLVTPEAGLPTEKEIHEAEPDIVAPSNKKKSKKDKKKRASAQLDLGNSDIILETSGTSSAQQDAIAPPQPSDATYSLAESVADIPDAHDAQVVNNTEDLSSSSKKSKKNKKRQSLALTEDEDTSDLPGPIPEAVSDVTEILDVPEQAKEDDADVSSASTSTKESKKEKKKKRQSVQFVEPIEESRETPTEGTDGIASPEVTAKPNEISLDALNQSTIPAEPASSPFDASQNLDQDRDVYTARNLAETPSLELGPSSVPLPADEDGTYLPHGVFSHSVLPRVQPGDDHLLEQQKHGETAGAEQGVDLQPQNDIDISVHTQSQGDNEIQEPIASQPEVIESDITSDAPVKAGDPALSDGKSPAEAMLVTKDPIPATPNEEIPLVSKKTKKDKKKRKGKSQENQESTSDSTALVTTVDDGVPTGEYQETPSVTLPHEPQTKPSEVAESKEQSAIEHPAVDKPAVDESAVNEPAVDELAVHKPAVEEPAVDELAVGELAVGKPAVDELAVDELAVGKPAVDEPAVDELAVDESAVHKPTVGELAVDKPAVDEPAVDELAADKPAVDEPAVDKSVVEPALDDLTPESPPKKSKKGKKKGKKGSKVLEDELTLPSDMASSSALDDGATSQDIVNVPESVVQEETEEVLKPSDTSKLPTDEQGLSSEAPPTALPSTPNDHNQLSQDDQIGTTIAHPEDEMISLTEPGINDISTGEPATLTTSELERSLNAQASGEQPEPTVTRKSKKDKKKKKRDNLLSVDRLDTTENASTEPTVGVENPAAVLEQTTTESLPDTSENQAALAHHIEPHPQQADSHPGIELFPVAPITPIKIEGSLDLPKPSEPPSDQLPVRGEAPAEDFQQASIRKTKEDEAEQVSSWDNEPSLPEPAEQTTEKSAIVQTSEGTGLSISLPPEESKNDDTANSDSFNMTKKDKKKKKLASLADGEGPSGSSAEPAQPVSDSPEQNEASLPTEPESFPGDIPLKSEDTPQVEGVVNIDNSSSLTPTKQSKKDKKKKRTSSADLEGSSERQLESAQSGPNSQEQNNLGVPIEPETPPVDELPKAEDTENISTPTPTKKSKKKKKKIANREEETPLEDQKDDTMLGETEQSDFFTTVPAEAFEKDITVETVSKDVDAAQDETIPQDDFALKDDNTPKDDNASDEAVPKDAHILRVEDSASDETTSKVNSNPRDGDVTQGETVVQEGSAPKGDNTLGPEPTLEKEAAIQDETALQDESIPDNQPLDDLAPTKKSKKNKKKKKHSISQADEFPEEIAAKDPIPTATAELAEPGEDQTPIPTPASQNDNGHAEPAPANKGISWEDGVSKEQPTSESATTADHTTDPVVNEPPAPEPSNDDGLTDLAAIEKDKSTSPNDEVPEEKLTGDSAADMIDPVLNEPPGSEPANDDGSAQSTSTKKSKKDKKKKKQAASREDDAAQQAPPKEDLPKAQAEAAQGELPQEDLPQGGLPKEDLSREEGFKEQLLQEQPTREVILEVGQGTLTLEEPEQISLPLEVQSEAPSEPATVLKPGELANDEVPLNDLPPNDDFPSLTPAKKSKKDKKKKKQTSSSDAKATPQEEPVHLEDSQPLAIAESVPGAGLPTEGEAPKVIMPDDAKEHDFTQLTPTKSKKDKKKKKQAVLEADLTSEPAEPSAKAVLPDARDTSEQTGFEVSPPNISGETEAIQLPSTKKGKKGGKKKEPASWEDELLLQPGLGQEPGISRDASAEPSQSEELLEFTLSKKGKKDKKKERADALGVKPEPEVQTGDRPESVAGPAELVESTGVSSSGPPGEQPPVHVTEDQDIVSQEIKTPTQDEVTNSPDRFDISTQALDTTSKEETASSMNLDEAVESNIELKLSETTAKTPPEGATLEPSSEDQQTTTRAAGNEPLDEVALEKGPAIGTDYPPPLQGPETMQLEEAPPKVDDGMDTVSSKKSKKDKKKKKRASQVSWEPEPEPEIEDLPERQQSERTFDEQPMTTDTTEMGNSGEAVEDPFPEFASDKKFKKERQNQMDWDPEPNSGKVVEELKSLPPTEQGQHDDMLLDQQSLAEDTQTSLKHSTNLDDTLLETTSSQKSKKKKKKVSQLDGDAEPATPVASEPAADQLFIDQGISDKSPELVDTPLAEPTETVQAEANPENFPLEIVSTKPSKNVKHRAEKQSAAEIPELEIDIGQPARNNTTTSDDIPSQIGLDAAENSPTEDALGSLAQTSVPYEQDSIREQSRNVLADEVQPQAEQAQDEERLSQDQSIVHGTNTEDTSMNTDIGPSHETSLDGQDAAILPSTLEGGLDEVAGEDHTEEPKDTTDSSQHLPQEDPEPSTGKPHKEKRKSKRAQALGVSDAGSNINPTAHLQSWDWSNIDNVTQPETPVPERVSVPEDPSQAKSRTAIQPSHALHTTSQQERKEESNYDDVDSTQPALGELERELQPQPQPELQLEPDPEELPVTRKKSKKDKKKRKEISQSESEQASGAQTPQVQDFEGGDDPQDVVPRDPTIREVEIIDPQDDERASSRKKKTQRDKMRGKALLLEETPSESQIMLGASQNIAASQQQSLGEIPQGENQSPKPQGPPAVDEPVQPQEKTAVTDDAVVEKPANVSDIVETGQLAVSESLWQTPLPDHQAFTTVDMSPAQLSSHIEHDRPFDQSTQPDKKLRTHLAEDDTMLLESLSTMTAEPPTLIPEGSNPQTADATARDIPSVLEEPIEQEKKGEILDNAAEDTTIVTHIEPEPMNVDDLQAVSSKENESKDPDLVKGNDTVPLEESPTSTSDRKKKQTGQADEDQSPHTATAIGPGVGGVVEMTKKSSRSEKAKGKEKSKYADKRTQKDDDIFDDPALWESSGHKALEEGSKLDADSSDFRSGPSTKAEEKPNKTSQEIADPAASEEVLELAHHQDHGIDDIIVESSVRDCEIVPELLRASNFEETGQQIKEATTAEAQDSLDRKTSEQLETHHQPPLREEPYLPSLPPPRTPSALDYSRSLPPVEEETHEDLEKELQSSLEDKTQVESEANRDSGFITDSPNPQRHSLGLDDAGQHDSGVHMRSWTEATTPGPSEEIARSKESHTRTASGPVDKDSSSQTPQPHERRSRRSLFDNETPKLGTPTQGRGWERGTTPDKPTEDEPLKRATKYPDLTASRGAGAALQPFTPQHQTQRSVSDNTNPGAIKRETTPRIENVAQRSTSSVSISRLRTPELSRFRPDSPGSNSVRSIHSFRSVRSGANTPPLRRVDRRMSGDLRSLSHNSSSTPSLSGSTRAKDPVKERDGDRDTAREASSDRHALPSNTTPIANEGRVRTKDMTDVYDGYGEGRIGSPRSPTRPPSMRRRQSMQVLELESRVEQLLAENRALADARAKAEQSMNYRNTSAITDRDAEIENLKASLQWLQNEVTRLTEVNEGLQSANSLLALQHNEKYTRLESQHTTTARELEKHRGAKDQYTQTLQAKDAEIQELRNQLEATKEQIREMKQQILAAKPPDADFLRLKDEDHFDHRCQQLCSHVQQWVLRFSKFSDMRACRLTSEINDEKIIDRLDNTILDGSDVDDYLSDRVARRDIFMSMTMNMIWEFVFTRYLFGMDREQRQKLKSLEKLLTDVGPPHAVRQWRAITLTLLSRRPAFGDQRNQDTEAVVQAILQTLSIILPPPSNLEAQIQSQLRRVMREAVDLSIEMRTQRAEYMMLPPLQPEYDANGELTQTVTFNAALMNERSGDSSTTNEAYEAQGAIVRCVLFPLVVKKGDDNGIGDDEIVVSPAQVLVAKLRRSTIRMVTPSSDAGGVSLSNYGGHSNVSVNMQDTPLTPDYV